MAFASGPFLFTHVHREADNSVQGNGVSVTSEECTGPPDILYMINESVLQKVLTYSVQTYHFLKE